MEKLVWTMNDVGPTVADASWGKHGAASYYLINKKTVGAEAMRMHVQVFQPGAYSKNHPIHDDREQTFYVMSGTMTIQLGEKEYVAPAGSFVFIPRGVEHNPRNEGDEELVFITINCLVRSGEVPPLPEKGQ